MNRFPSITLSLIAALAFSFPAALLADTVNVDFLAQGVNESTAPNFAGPGPIGTGTFYNGLAANDSAGTQTLVVTGTSLKDSAGTTTGVNVSFGPSGADNQGGGHPSPYGPLNGGYLYETTGTPIAFSITGLATATTENLLFTTSDWSDLGAVAPTFTFGGGTQVTYTPTNGNTLFTNGNGLGAGAGFGQTAGNTYEFDNVNVNAGAITGSLANVGNGTLIFSALTIEGAVPEPSTYAMMLLGLGAVGFCVRRKASLL